MARPSPLVPLVNPHAGPLMPAFRARTTLRGTIASRARCSNEFSDLRGAPVHDSDAFPANCRLDLYPRATFGRGPQFSLR